MSDGYKNINDLMGFGKYKDKTLRWVLVNDTAYIQWMANQDNLKAKIECLPDPQKRLINIKLDELERATLGNIEARAWFGSDYYRMTGEVK